MIDAGTQTHYQHYRTLSTLATAFPWLLTVVAMQAIAIVLATVRHLRAISSASTSLRLRIAIAVLLTAAVAATVSADPRRYAAELAFAALLQILAAANLAFAAAAIP